MIRLFKSAQLTPFFVLPFITLVLWIPGFMKTDFLQIEPQGIFGYLLSDFLNSVPQFLLVILAIVLVTGEAIYLNQVLNRHEVLYKNTRLPALIYIILMSFNNDVISFHIILLVNLCLIILCDKFFSLFKNENASKIIFDSGMLIALVSMFYLPFISLLLFLVIVLIIIRPFRFREWLVAFIGFLLPYFFLGVYYFLKDTLQKNVSLVLHESVFGIPETFRVSLQREAAYFLFVIYLMFMIFVSLVRLRANFFKNTVKTRSTQQVMIFISMLIAAEGFFLSHASLFFYLQLAIPFSVFIAYLYATSKKRVWLYEVSLWFFLILIVQSYF